MRRTVLRVGLATALALALLSLYGVMEARSLTVTEYRVTSPALPPSFDGLRIAFLSDIHRGRWVSQERVAGVVDRVNGSRPDVVVLGGDYVYGDDRYIESCFSELSRLRAPLGVFGVLGNHDHDQSARSTRAAMAAAGVVDLSNTGAWIERGGARVRLVGVDDMLEASPDLERALEGTGVDDYVLLLSHSPDFVGELATIPAGSVDLMLSGHTHGGQVTFFGLWAPLVPSDFGQTYRTGLVTTGPVPVVVSNGIGVVPPPIRLFAPPQIVVVELGWSGS